MRTINSPGERATRRRTARPANLQRIIWNLIRRHINAWSTTDKTVGEKWPRSSRKRRTAVEITKSAAFILRVLNPGANKTARTYAPRNLLTLNVFCSSFQLFYHKRDRVSISILDINNPILYLASSSTRKVALPFNTVSVSLVVAEKRSDESQADLGVNEIFSKTALLLETSIHDPPWHPKV